MKTIRLFSLLTIIIVLAACSQTPAASDADQIGIGVSTGAGSYTDISVGELQTMLVEKDFTFVNVHIPFEGDLPGTDLSIAYNQIGEQLDLLPADKDAKIVLYCRSGSMSADAAETLVGLGYTNVWNLAGGFNAWKAAGLPMARE